MSIVRIESINGDYNEIRQIPGDEAAGPGCACCNRELPTRATDTVTYVKQFSDYPYPIRWEFCDQDCWRIFKEKYYSQPEIYVEASNGSS